MVSPPYPELFASGCIINGFTPQDKSEAETLIEAIKVFEVSVVLVVDNEKLENDIKHGLNLAQANMTNKTQVIQLPKSPGVQAQKFDKLVVFEKYQEYFRGKHYASFSRRDQARLGAEFGQESLMSRNEFDPQDIKIVVDDYKIYKIEGCEIPITA